MKFNKDKTSLTKIKINYINNEFWIAPNLLNIFSFKRSEYIVKKANNLIDIFQSNNLLENYYVSFNKDPEFKLFNTLQKLSNYLTNLQITNKVIKEIEKNNIYYFHYNDNISIKFDEKVLWKIYRGNSFLVSNNYFENYINDFENKSPKKEKYIFYWTGSNFEIE